MPFLIPIGTALGVGGAGTAAAVAGGAAVAAVGAGIGTSVYSSQAQANQAKKSAAHQADLTKQAQDKMAKAESTAASQAAESIRRRQASMTRSKSIYTSPLGIQTQAQTARKALLGE